MLIRWVVRRAPGRDPPENREIYDISGSCTRVETVTSEGRYGALVYLIFRDSYALRRPPEISRNVIYFGILYSRNALEYLISSWESGGRHVS